MSGPAIDLDISAMYRVLIVLLILIPVPVYAIVDVQDQFFSNPEVNAFSVFALDFAGSAGNKDEQSFNLTSHNVLRRDPSTWLFVADWAFSEVNNLENENNRFAHLRYIRDLAGPHGFELLAQYSEDKFASLDRRDVYGGGYRFQWVRGTGTRRGLAGFGVIREIEQYVDTVGERKRWRANMYMTVARPFQRGGDASIGLTTYLQPALGSKADLRGIAVLTIKAPLTERLAVNMGLNYNYESDPAPGRERYTMTYSSGLTYTFK
jgi:hypothetical protein